MLIEFIPAKRFKAPARLSLRPFGLVLLAVAAVVLTAGIGLPLIGICAVLWMAVKQEH